jgi:hypothetical protein
MMLYSAEGSTPLATPVRTVYLEVIDDLKCQPILFEFLLAYPFTTLGTSGSAVSIRTPADNAGSAECVQALGAHRIVEHLGADAAHQVLTDFGGVHKHSLEWFLFQFSHLNSKFKNYKIKVKKLI